MFSDLFIERVILKKLPENKNESYIFDLDVVKHLADMGEMKFKKNVTFIVGENGSGKSTLLEAIAVSWGFNAEGGSRNYNFASNETHSILNQYLTISKGVRKPKDGFFFRAESFYNVATEADNLDNIIPMMSCYGGKSLHNQSHGQSFNSLILNRFGGNGLYILDEPEAALSPTSQFTLMVQINELVKNNSQFIIATHSPILMAYPQADIFVLNEEGINLIPYLETDNYILTKQFIENPDKILRYLFED